MKLHLLGVRGSTPAPGPLHVRYDGHTCAVAIAHDGCPPTLVLDAGTGLRALSDLLAEQAYHGAIALTHLHWDHIQGLPFFAKGDDPAAEVDVYLPAQDGRSGHDLLAGALSPPYFPILPEGPQGAWTFTALSPGTMTMRGFTVTAFEVEHKGGRTFGYRVEDDSGSIAYLPEPGGRILAGSPPGHSLRQRRAAGSRPLVYEEVEVLVLGHEKGCR